ncbi:hypothetical protein H6A33_07430 [Collinsella tanakaei]|nr:hypothetical protein [Collinsella tanakaei]
MSPILFTAEAATACLLFSAVVWASLKRDPMLWYQDFPAAVRERLKMLPEYTGRIPKLKRTVARKVVVALVLAALLAGVALASGARNFTGAFGWCFALWTVVNLWDALVLDTLWFSWGRGVRIPGTEDLEDAYLDVRPHWIAFLAGEAIGLAVSIIAACLVAFVIS